MQQIDNDTILPGMRTYKKTTTVLAFKMSQDTGATFQKNWGPQVCRKGDWVIIPLGLDEGSDEATPSGDIYGCEVTSFDQTYELVVPSAVYPGHHYRKKGQVRAVQMDKPFRVFSKEGWLTGDAGDWVVENGFGDRYLNRNAVFSKQYVLVA